VTCDTHMSPNPISTSSRQSDAIPESSNPNLWVCDALCAVSSSPPSSSPPHHPPSAAAAVAAAAAAFRIAAAACLLLLPLLAAVDDAAAAAIFCLISPRKAIRISLSKAIRLHIAARGMAYSAFNCSFSSSSAPYAYDPSRSAADAVQVCYRLLNAKCAYLGLDASYCSNSQSTATAEKVQKMFAANFCNNYYNISDSILAIVFGAPIIVAFMLNAFRLIVRAPRGLKSDNIEPGMRMADPLAEASMSIPSEEEAAQRSEHSDALGLFGRLLPFFGLQWIRAPKASRARQALRIFFLLWTALAVIPLCITFQRLYLARFDALSFLLTYNKCSSMCSASGGSLCSQPYDFTFKCLTQENLSLLTNYFECFQAGKVDALVRSGLAVQLMLLLLPLHSAISCAFLWPRPDNAVLLALHAQRQLSPDGHRQCCAAAMKFIAVLAIVLALLSILSSQIYNPVYTDSCNDGICPSLNVALVFPQLICQVVIYAFLSLTPVAMVALFAFTAFIVRLRMRAFGSVAQFVGTSMLLHLGDHQSLTPAHAPVLQLSAHDVLTALHICRCPHSVLSKCRALLLVEGGGGYRDAASVMQPHLRLLWTMQLRDVQVLAKFGEKWLAVQTVFALSILLPIAAFLSLASQYSALLSVVLGILQIYFLFCVPFVAAMLALAIGNFYVQHACDKLSLLLQRCSEAAETNTEALGPGFNGQDSLASIVAFCRFTSQDAFRLYDVQINWLSLARFVYYMGLLVWVLSSSLIGVISSGLNIGSF